MPGVIGQGKYGENRVYWDKLKTLVTEMGITPSQDLLKAYASSSNQIKHAPDIEKTM